MRTTRLGPSDFAFFEAFPSNGAGTSGACSTTAPTGAKGEVLTFTRASNGTCTKTASGGLATTGIANGDLVVLSSNVARVEYDSAGTLGLLVEAARTNSIIRSEELDNVAWTLATGGAPNPGAPTRTANAGVAPDGTTTAERLDFPAVSGTGFSLVYNAAGRTSTAASWTHSVYVRGVSGVSDSGTIYLMSTPGGSYNSTACAYVSTSWSRCIVTGTETVATWYTQIGVDLRDGTQSGKSAQSVYLWGVDGEAGAYATSYIPTAGVAVARAAETGGGVFPLVPTSVATGSMSVRVQLMAAATQGLLSAEAAASFKQAIITFGGERAYVGAVSKVGPLTALAAGQRTAAIWWDGASSNLILDGAATAGAAGTPAATDTLRIGAYDATATTIEPGIYSRVCYDTSTTRCR